MGRPARPRVSNPDWHSAGWLSFPELKELVEWEHQRIREQDPEAYPSPAAWRDNLADLEAVVAAMSAYESILGEGKTRFVYWFDNRP